MDSSMNVDFYGMYSGRIELDTIYDRTYSLSNPSQYAETMTSYTYDPINYEVASTSIRQSNGDIDSKHFSYDGDFASYATLISNNILTLPIHTATYLTKAGSQTTMLLNSTVTEYDSLADGEIKSVDILDERLSQPDPNASGYYSGPGSNVSNYKTIQSFTYDGHGHVIGMRDEGLRDITKIYGYNDKFVVATIINANPLADKPAYSSFEDDGLGGWTLQGAPTYNTSSSITGSRSLVLAAGKTLTAYLNTSAPYRLSFWSTNSLSVSAGATLKKSAPTINGFTYYEYIIQQGISSITISGAGSIDELRVYPEKARMSSETYDPLIGKTSECDENNRITYYEYDNLGRLKFIKDDQGNIVKMYEYNNVSIAKQGGCPGTYYNHSISEVFTRSNCSSGTIGYSQCTSPPILN